MSNIPSFLSLLLCYYLLLIGLISCDSTKEEADQLHRHLRPNNNNGPCVKWGNTFDVPLGSKNVERKCTLPDGRAICCSATEVQDKNNPLFKPIGENIKPDFTISNQVAKCTVEKVYISSPQELRDLAHAKYIHSLSEDHTDPVRLEALLKYTLSAETIRNATIWLDRVKYHMSTEHPIPINNNQQDSRDWEFLSRFEYTRHCVDDGMKVSTDRWIEWIEPITITARHPFAFGRCRPVKSYLTPDIPRVDRSNVDYVLLQSGQSLVRQTFHRPAGQSFGHLSGHRNTTSIGSLPKHYMLDAGTSTFDSSLLWFTCGYAQQKIGFDSVYGWEMTLLEPRDYWSRVPAIWKPYWHFYNTPISPDLDHPDSPLRFLSQIAREEDFVAFKLDIDSPEHEMPIALRLLSDHHTANLIDEFFFELHFRCEVMTSCGWGKRVPPESHGLVLDRPHVLQFFMDLRIQGIRAHIWP